MLVINLRVFVIFCNKEEDVDILKVEIQQNSLDKKF